MQWFVLLAFVVVLLFALVRFQLSLLVWTAAIAGSLFVITALDWIGGGLATVLWFIFAVCMIPLHCAELCMRWLTEPVM